jgi:hypothetical protein
VAVVLPCCRRASTSIAQAPPSGSGAGKWVWVPDTTAESGPGSVAASGETGLAGTWAVVPRAITLNPDGTGSMAPAIRGDQRIPLAWKRDRAVAEIVLGNAILFCGEVSPESDCVVAFGETRSLGDTMVRISRQTADSLDEATCTQGQALALMGHDLGAGEDPTPGRVQCVANARRLARAMLGYAQSHDWACPPTGEGWQRALKPYDSGLPALRCPESRESGSYAINPALAGRRLGGFTGSSIVVMFFESDNGKDIAYRHEGGAVYGFTDGQVRWLKRGEERGPYILWETPQ